MAQISHRDLQSIQEARDLAERAHAAAQTMRSFTQEDADRICANMARKGFEARFTPHDFWFTQKDDAVYAISLVEPRGEVVIRSLNTSAGTVREVYVPGQGKVEYEQNKEGLTVRLPKEYLPENGFVVKAVIVK